ncbi:hypothetical protein [Kitasatospora sp. RG8]|uniref:hypothetical protein n=1 Tax=Kitasatospora sp. RG8 TaxID=2820815 RepID=UPI001FD73E95|nr:hypothetical protein [Kitasatospora sp. RG8]
MPITMSTPATSMVASAKTSRGQYTLLSRLRLLARLSAPWFMVLLKNCQTIRPT